MEGSEEVTVQCKPVDSVHRRVLNRNRLLLVLAAAMWSLSGVFVKSPPLDAIPLEVRGPLLACYRAMFAGLLLCPLVPLRSIRWRFGLVPMVVAFAAMNTLFVCAMTRTTAASAIFLQYTAAAWVAVIGYLALRERITRTTLISLIGAVAGIAWIVAAEDVAEHSTGNLIALGSGFSLACTWVMLRVLRSENAVWLTTLNHLAAGVVLLPWILAFDIRLTWTQWILIALFGIVQMGWPYVLFTRAVRHVPVTEAVLITLLEPLLNPLFVWLVWSRPIQGHVLIGGLFILGGLTIKYVTEIRISRKL